jgi:hypothetical protein
VVVIELSYTASGIFLIVAKIWFMMCSRIRTRGLTGWTRIARSARNPGSGDVITLASRGRSAARQKLGSLDKVTRVVRLCIYLATDGDFFDQPKVADAASELFRDVFREDKTSVRMVLGVASLPLGMPVAVEVILEVEA